MALGVALELQCNLGPPLVEAPGVEMAQLVFLAHMLKKSF